MPNAASAPLKPLLFALQDSVMLLAPRGWTTVELKVVPSGRLLRLAEVQTKGQGATEPKPMPELGVDSQSEAFRLSEGLSELVELLRARGKVWTPGTIEVDRQSGAADWRLKQPDGSLLWFSRLEAQDLSGLLITDALLDAVSGTERAFLALQGQLEARLEGVTGFTYDAATAQLSLEYGDGRKAVVPAQLVGRYGEEDYSWTWGWVSGEHRPHSSDRVRRICSPDAPAEGLSAFWRDQFQCDEGFSWALSGHVAVALGARGLFRGEVEERDEALVFALMEQP
jgi:hypothetical protein